MRRIARSAAAVRVLRLVSRNKLTTLRWGALAALLTAGWCLMLPAPAQAKERVADFLEGLRRAGYHAVAEEYLESLPARTDITEDVRQSIPYELARTLVEKARAMNDVVARMKELDRARAKYEEFIAASPAHPLVADANTQLGNVLVERAKTLLEMARRPANFGRKIPLRQEARDLFAQAQKVFDAAEQRLEVEYNKIKQDLLAKPEDQDTEKRKKSLNDLIQARLLSATVIYESSKAHDPGTEEQKQLLQAALAKYETLYQKFRRRAAGLYAGMFQGRCFQDLGDTKRALAIYSDLLLQPDTPEVFREIKAKTLALALQCWISDTEKLYEVAVQKGEEWLQNARRDEGQRPEGLAIRYFTALGLDRQIETLQADPAKQDEAKRRKANLVLHATEVTKVESEYQPLAKALLARYQRVKEEGEPETFAAARDAAKVALDAMQVALNKIKVATVTKNQEMLDQVQVFKQEEVEARDAAVRYYNLALSLRDDETSIDEINVVRYHLAYLHYSAQRYYESAVLAEFLARRYPDSAAAKPAAEIALAAYQQGYNESPPDDRRFEIDSMIRVAEYVARQWPADEAADKAWMMLADIAIREKKLAEAAAYLAKIPPESPRRGEADLKSGQALWSKYLSDTGLAEGEGRPPQAELDALVQQAQATLETGIQRMRQAVVDPSQVTYTLVASELSLAQIYNGSGQPEKAIELLERPDSGPLALVRGKSDIVQKGNFPNETYKAALRGYVGKQDLASAEKVMVELETQGADEPDAAANLTKVYISLGLELEEQVKRLKTLNQPEELEKVLDGFESFLTRIRSREQGNTFSSLNWVADTFYNLAAGLDTDEKLPPPAESKGYYNEALQTYQSMLEKLQAGSLVPPSVQTDIGLQIRVARCQRRLGNYKQAVDILAGLLKTNPKMLDAQIEAAYAYQDWGGEKAAYYNSAMRGARADKATGENLIWGWGKLSTRVQREPAYKPQFHEARYNLAECRFRLGMSQKEKEKAETLRLAEQDIAVTLRLNPDMGGEESYKRYDRLLKTIQGAAGNKSTGLKGLQSPPKPGNTARAPTR